MKPYAFANLGSEENALFIFAYVLSKKIQFWKRYGLQGWIWRVLYAVKDIWYVHDQEAEIIGSADHFELSKI